VRVQSGELLALLGPSGSGKTTLLRIMAGLEAPDVGSVRYGGQEVTGVGARQRNVGFVFQHYALFNHLTVLENIAFGLRVRKVETQEANERVNKLLKLIRLEHLANRLPSQLSGGQRQRVALARALAPHPSVLLLDEPFGALDVKVREELRDWLRRLHEDMRVTSVFVTHDQEEAMEIADRIVVTNKGRIEQSGSPDEVFEQPGNAFVADFLGRSNVIRGHVVDGRAVLGGLDVAQHTRGVCEAGPVVGYVRHSDVLVKTSPGEQGSWTATVRRIWRLGTRVKVALEVQDFPNAWAAELDAEDVSRLSLAAGMRVYLSPRQVRVFSDDSASLRC